MQSKKIKRGERKSFILHRIVEDLPSTGNVDKVTFGLRKEGSKELS